MRMYSELFFENILLETTVKLNGLQIRTKLLACKTLRSGRIFFFKRKLDCGMKKRDFNQGINKKRSCLGRWGNR